MLKCLPLKQPQPDAKRFIDILMGRADGRKPPLVEYLIDDVIRRPVITGLLGREWVETVDDREAHKAHLDNFIEFWYRMGYDFVRYEQGLAFPERTLLAPDTAEASSGQRSWVDEHQGTITSWEDFEQYPWPKVEDMDFFPFDYINEHLPEGMGLISCHGAGPFEHLSWIMSIEGLCFAIYEEPDLVQAVADKLGELMMGVYRHIADLDSLIALFQGDDMGFRTCTLIGPDHLRKYTLPWHKRFAALAHEKGIPYFLHSCGQLDQILEVLISDVGIDGKHSFEDAIIPANEFQAQYGDRIAVLGGVDLNILAAGSPEQVRERTRGLMEICGARGRYAVGSGNSIPTYVPVENYLAMVDEAVAFSSPSE